MGDDLRSTFSRVFTETRNDMSLREDKRAHQQILNTEQITYARQILSTKAHSWIDEFNKTRISEYGFRISEPHFRDMSRIRSIKKEYLYCTLSLYYCDVKQFDFRIDSDGQATAHYRTEIVPNGRCRSEFDVKRYLKESYLIGTPNEFAQRLIAQLARHKAQGADNGRQMTELSFLFHPVDRWERLRS